MSAAGAARIRARRPHELVAIGDRVGFDGDGLATASRLVAKVDSAAVQDGFDLYLHGFIVADDGRWVVVQQGMNGDTRQARRYHWLSEGLKSFVEAPHSAIDGEGQGVIVNLTDMRAAASRRRQIDLLGDLGPDGIARQVARLEEPKRAGARRRGRSCRISSCPRITTYARKTSSTDACTPISRPPPIAGRRISPSFCSCRESARARCARSRRSPRSCTARRTGSATRPASRSPTAERTATPFRRR